MSKELQMEGDGEEKMEEEETEGDEDYDNFYEGEGEVDILSSLVSPSLSTAGSLCSSPAISFDHRDRAPQSEWEEIPSRRWLSSPSTRSASSHSRGDAPGYSADQSAAAPKLRSRSDKKKKFVLWQKIWWRRSKFDEGWVLEMMRATSNEEINLKRFHHPELMRATRNFSLQEKIGSGSFGVVYKGFLPELNMHVAIKRLRRESFIKKAINEAIIVSQLKHRNIVQLIGWCLRLDEFFLIYELMHNGSLDDHLFDSGKELLTWPVRLKIVLDLASALRYLHEEWGQCLVHRDIKPGNVLLDSDFNAKLGDFGLSRLAHDGIDYITTAVVGTMGYLAPEYVREGRYRKECDVYSFGVVALVIACGKRPMTLMTEEEDGEQNCIFVVEWVRDIYGRNAILEAADERLNMEFDEEQMERLMMVGLWCTEDDYKSRPSMSQVINVLTGETPMPYILPRRRLATMNMISDISSLSSFDGHNAHVPTDLWSAFQHGYNISTELKDKHVASPSRVIDYEASPFDKGVTVNLERHETVIEEGMTFDTSASDTTEPEDVKTVEVLNPPATATTVPYVGVDKPQLPAQPGIPINGEDGSDDILDSDEEINIDRIGTLPIPEEHHIKIADGQKVSAHVVVVPDETPDVAAMPIEVQVTKDEVADSAIGEAMTRAPSSTGETDSTAVDKLSISTSTCSTSSEPGPMRLRDRRKRMASLLVNEVLEMLKTFLPEEADEVSETISNVIKSLDSLGVDVAELVKLTEGVFKLTAEREARATVFSVSREEEIQKQLTDLKETLTGKATLASKIQESVDLAKAEEANLGIHAEELKAQVRQLEVQLEGCRAQIQEASKRQEEEQATLNHIFEEKEIIQQKIATLEAELTHLTPEGLLPSQVLQQMDDRLAEAKIALEFWQLRF